MAGEDLSSAAAAPASPEPAAPVAETAPAPVEAAAPAETLLEGAPEAAAVAEPAAEPAAEPEAPAEPEAAPIAEPAAEPAPEAAAPEAEKPPAEAAAPVYEDFTLPEGFQAAPEQIAEFTGLLTEAKLDQETGQKFMDLHAKSLQAAVEQMSQRQVDTFEQTRSGWRTDADTRFGNRRDTIINDAKFAITQLVPDAKAQKELWGVLGFTGAGDHPALISAFAAAAPRLRERPAPPGGLPNTGAKLNPAERRYGPKQ